jgi:hypothetical protein
MIRLVQKIPDSERGKRRRRARAQAASTPARPPADQARINKWIRDRLIDWRDNCWCCRRPIVVGQIWTVFRTARSQRASISFVTASGWRNKKSPPVGQWSSTGAKANEAHHYRGRAFAPSRSTACGQTVRIATAQRPCGAIAKEEVKMPNLVDEYGGGVGLAGKRASLNLSMRPVATLLAAE